MSATIVMLPEVEVVQQTDPGKDPDKQVNEDTCRYGETPFGHLLLLCDGMGGHDAGREASTRAVETVFRHLGAAALRPDMPPAERAREILRDAVANANREVCSMGDLAHATRPGSTLVAVLVHARGTEVAHVGDSRAYLVHDGAIRQLTRDHSMVQELVDAGALSPAEAAGHPESNKITRALGMAESVDVEITSASIVHAAGDTFVVCSDGLSDLVGALEMQDAVGSLALPDAAAKLVEAANARGGHDNITVGILRTKQGVVAPPPEISEPMAFRKTEPMSAVPEALGAPQSPLSPSSPPGATPDGHPLLPPAPPASRRTPKSRRSRGALVAIVGGAVLLTVLVAVAMHLARRGDEDDATGNALPIVFPGASLQHGREPLADGDVDASGPDAGRAHRPKKKNHK